METIEDIVREMREGMGWPNPDGRPLTARVQDHLFKIYADRIEEACSGCTQFKRAKQMAKENLCLRKKNARLRAALKAIRDGETMFDYASPNKIAELALNESEAKL